MTNRIDKDSVQILINSNKKPYVYGTVAKGLWLYISPTADPDLVELHYEDIEMILSQMQTKEQLLCLRDNQEVKFEEEEIL